MVSQLLGNLSPAAARPLCGSFRAGPVRASRHQIRVHAVTTVPAEFKTVTPVGDRVFVKVDDSDSLSIGGIILPASAQKKPTQGKITSAGNAKFVKAGDTVLYSKYAGTELKLNDEAFVLLKEEDCIANLPGDDVRHMQPLGDRILIQVEGAEAKTSGGVLLTESAKEKPTLGKVVAVGPGKEDDDGKLVAPNVAVGSTVLYSKYSGTEYKGKDDTDYIVVRESDILATLS